ncbi:MAG: dihydropteroate synthase, partial [Gammaproteobacteria bacterium]|nr:dihydropteroate synthase [Gammaproteobacteria bacterium]
GESTRPGAQPLTAAEESDRVVPVIKVLRSVSDIAISIDTSKADVMRAAVEAGANLVNDVRALQEDGVVEVVAELGVTVCLMHMQGEPRSMQHNPDYNDVVNDVKAFLQQRIEYCVKAGIAQEKIIIDPGFGFGKTLDHNLSLLKHLAEFVSMGFPVLIGISRKSMLGQILDAKTDQRVAGGLATTVLGYQSGVQIFRVHDVKEAVDVLKVCHAVKMAT